MTATADRLASLVAPVAEDLALTVYDVEDASGTLRVLLDAEGGVDVDTLAAAARSISRAMDADGSFASTVTLEVSSPGLERRLRTSEHMAAAVGERVKVKLRPGVVGDRRVEGVLSAADGSTVTVTPDDGEPRTVPFDDITSARTVFEWGPAPRPGKRPGSGTSAASRPRTVDAGGSGGTGHGGTDRIHDSDSDSDSDAADGEEAEVTP